MTRRPDLNLEIEEGIEEVLLDDDLDQDVKMSDTESVETRSTEAHQPQPPG